MPYKFSNLFQYDANNITVSKDGGYQINKCAVELSRHASVLPGFKYTIYRSVDNRALSTNMHTYGFDLSFKDRNYMKDKGLGSFCEKPNQVGFGLDDKGGVSIASAFF